MKIKYKNNVEDQKKKTDTLRVSWRKNLVRVIFGFRLPSSQGPTAVYQSHRVPDTSRTWGCGWDNDVSGVSPEFPVYLSKLSVSPSSHKWSPRNPSSMWTLDSEPRKSWGVSCWVQKAFTGTSLYTRSGRHGWKSRNHKHKISSGRWVWLFCLTPISGRTWTCPLKNLWPCVASFVCQRRYERWNPCYPVRSVSGLVHWTVEYVSHTCAQFASWTKYSVSWNMTIRQERTFSKSSGRVYISGTHRAHAELCLDSTKVVESTRLTYTGLHHSSCHTYFETSVSQR